MNQIMDASILRLDWYSFLVGTHMAVISGSSILFTPSPLRTSGRPRLAREYLRPTFLGEGNTVFFFRIKESANLLIFGTKLLIREIERSIFGGFAYHLMTKYVDMQNASLMTILTLGGILGIGFNLRYNFDNVNRFCDTLFLGFATGEVAACGEVIRQSLFSSKGFTVDDFNISLPYSPISFWNGAITGCALALYFADVIEYTELIWTPEIEADASNLDVFMEYASYFQDVLCGIAKFGLFVAEKSIVGGVLYCAFEMALKQMTNWRNAPVVVLFCGSALGIYSGIHYALHRANPSKRIQKAWAMSLMISSGCQIYFMTLQKLLEA